MNKDLRNAFIEAATWHGGLDEANAMLEAEPALSVCDIHTAAITGNEEAVQNFLFRDPTYARATAPPYGCNALVYLCMSKYLRLESLREPAFIRIAQLLLDAGFDPNSGFWSTGQYPEFETALYGAAGIAHHAALTRLLLAYGANPNDEEAVYHSPETYANEAMMALVESGKLTTDSLSVMLIRKIDFHDYDGQQYLLGHGANANGQSRFGWYPLHHALTRANHVTCIELLMNHGADPLVTNNGLTAISRAAREGRADVLKLFSEKGISLQPDGINGLIAACALNDADGIAQMIAHSPQQKKQLIELGSELLARFCLCGNDQGVQQLLHLGINVNTPYDLGDGYYEIPRGSLPIHIASWLGRSDTVRVLIQHGAQIDAVDAKGRTPLMLAVLACTNSYWKARRTPDVVKMLLDAGASRNDIKIPTGYDAIDHLLVVS